MITLIHKKDFKIIQVREIVEYFIWNCPNCGKDCKSMEYSVRDKELFCSNCSKFFPYSWE
jgi:transposase